MVKLPKGVKSFELKPDMFRMIHNSCMFAGDPDEDAADHINAFVQIRGTFRIPDSIGADTIEVVSFFTERKGKRLVEWPTAKFYR